MIDQGLATLDDTTVVNGALVWRTATAIRPPGEPQPGMPRMHFQEVPEEKSGKNRLHLDIRTGDYDGSLDELRQTLIDRGGTELYTGQQGPHSWTTMADPEGNEFCI
jgi:hypothetical protein